MYKVFKKMFQYIFLIIVLVFIFSNNIIIADSATLQWNYSYTNSVQTFIAPYKGEYKIDVWGAQGGSSDTAQGGKGGYSNGVISLNKGQILYVVVGGAGKPSINGGYNGGGNSGYYPSRDDGAGSGGGATHIAYSNHGELKNYSEHEEDLIIVAGGGGGAYISDDDTRKSGGSGGGENEASGPMGQGYSCDYTNSHCGGGGAGYTSGLEHEGGSGFLSSELTEATTTSNVRTGDGYAQITYLPKYALNIKVNGESIPNFDPDKSNYTVYVNYDVEEVEIEVTKNKATSVVTLPTDLRLYNYENDMTVSVYDKEINETKEYNIKVVKEDGRLEKINVSGARFIDNFNPDVYTYDLISEPGANYADVTVEAFYSTTEVSGIGAHAITNKDTFINIVTTDRMGQVYIYTLHVTKYEEINADEYSYVGTNETNGSMQMYKVPKTGYYKLEVWGAQGGSLGSVQGGKGGYSTGLAYLKKGDTLYIYIGGQGTTTAGGYNGGGNPGPNETSTGGGGATHIALKIGELSTFENDLDNLLIVAGGGGGAKDVAGAVGGGLEGGSIGTTTGGTQSEAGVENASFGKGGSSNDTGSGGGSGYYGGGAGLTGAGAGGSGYAGSLD